jgi:chorismate mutase/prephenate dehydratase
VFFVDIDGHAEDDGIREALEEMSGQTDLFRVLGSYPKAIA